LSVQDAYIEETIFVMKVCEHIPLFTVHNNASSAKGKNLGREWNFYATCSGKVKMKFTRTKRFKIFVIHSSVKCYLLLKNNKLAGAKTGSESISCNSQLCYSSSLEWNRCSWMIPSRCNWIEQISSLIIIENKKLKKFFVKQCWKWNKIIFQSLYYFNQLSNDSAKHWQCVALTQYPEFVNTIS
jgi:hypothetical protein